tara:strand:+ start:659 stop:1132 length:474 start_codon:yes stop_codon:yes gene_type:complete
MTKLNFGRKKSDLIWGLENEKIVFEYIEALHPNEDVYFFRNKYNEFDFFVLNSDKEIIHEYELKSRRKINFHTHEDLMFGANKKDYADEKLKLNPNCKFTVMWYLTAVDEVYFWNYYDSEKQKHQYEIRLGWNGNEKRVPCVFVKTQFMTQLELYDE